MKNTRIHITISAEDKGCSKHLTIDSIKIKMVMIVMSLMVVVIGCVGIVLWINASNPMGTYELRLASYEQELRVNAIALQKQVDSYKQIEEEVVGLEQALSQSKQHAKSMGGPTREPYTKEELEQALEQQTYKNAQVEARVDNPYVPSYMPCEGEITSWFGTRDNPFSRGSADNHKGIDIGADYGDPIYAAATGVVTVAGYVNGYGYTVLIDHQNGIETRYAHASKLLVSEGETVEKGQAIAKIGSTGNSTGPHLHFEWLEKGVHINPEKLFIEE